MPLSDETQFDYLYSALAQKYPGIADADGTTTNFQFMETPMGANWTSGDDADAFHLADSTSSNLDGWFVPGNGFANAYKDLVLSIEPARGSNNPNYRKDVSDIATIDKQIQNTTKKARSDYQLFLANNPGTQETYTQWINDAVGGKNWAEQLATLRTQREDFVTNMKDVVKALDTALYQAQADVNPWSETMNIDEGSAPRKVPLTTIGGNLQDDISSWNNRSEGEYDFDVVITKQDTATRPWKPTYKTKIEHKCASSTVDVKAQIARIIADNNYKLRVTAVGVNSYKINRGQWFHENLVMPSKKIVQGSAWTNDDFFGPQGSLHLIPEVVFVMYRPSIKLTISTQLYKQLFTVDSVAKVDWLDLLGFRFDIDGLASLQPEGDTTTTVTFNAPDDQLAQVVGIVSKVTWNKDL